MALPWPRGRSAASASRGAYQPEKEDRHTPAAAPARGAPQPASFTVASFNFGFEQSSKRARLACASLALRGVVRYGA
eukprot:1503226-Pyramimonas_sp.AAC.1